MPSICSSFNPNVGAIVNVAILPINEFQEPDGTPKTPDPANIKFFNGLLDTGASCTCISASAAKQAKLSPTGKAQMVGATGADAKNQYGFGVGFMVNQRQDASGNTSGQLNVRVVNGMEFDNHGGAFDLLIGRDIICEGVLTMSSDGHFTLSF